MERIDAEHLYRLVLELIPSFELNDERVVKGRSPNECWIFMRLLDTVDEWVRQRDDERLFPVLALVERSQTEGTPDVANDACTCFLESLSNRLGWQRPELKPWIRERLGPHSLAFWDTWNQD